MTNNIGDLDWRYDDRGCRFIATGHLESWSDYSHAMGDLRYQGFIAQFRLADVEIDAFLQISAGCKRAYSWLLKNNQDVHQQLMKALTEFLPTLREQWQEFGDDEMLEIDAINDLRDKLNLAYVKLFPHENHDTPYFGFDFYCVWDSEGFRVLLNGTRIVEIQADELSIATVEADGVADLTQRPTTRFLNVAKQTGS